MGSPIDHIMAVLIRLADAVGRVEYKVDEVIARQRRHGRELHHIMADIDTLEAAIAPLTSTSDSVIALLQDLVARYDAANTGNDPRIRAVTDMVRANLDRLAAAVVANTPNPNLNPNPNPNPALPTPPFVP